jgi:hypothetical protein
MKTAKEIVESDGLTEHDQCEGYILKVQDIVGYMEQYAESEVEKLNLHNVMQRSEQLISFVEWLKKHDMMWGFTPELIVEGYLKEINCA